MNEQCYSPSLFLSRRRQCFDLTFLNLQLNIIPIIIILLNAEIYCRGDTFESGIAIRFVYIHKYQSLIRNTEYSRRARGARLRVTGNVYSTGKSLRAESLRCFCTSPWCISACSLFECGSGNDNYSERNTPFLFVRAMCNSIPLYRLAYTYELS